MDKYIHISDEMQTIIKTKCLKKKKKRFKNKGDVSCLKQITQPNVRLDFLAPCRHDLPEETQRAQCLVALFYWTLKHYKNGREEAALLRMK